MKIIFIHQTQNSTFLYMYKSYYKLHTICLFVNNILHSYSVPEQLLKITLKKLSQWDTVYKFEIAQTYFRPIKIWDWFTQSWIQPLYNFLSKSFTLTDNLDSPIFISPLSSCQWAKIKWGEFFPVYSILNRKQWCLLGE